MKTVKGLIMLVALIATGCAVVGPPMASLDVYRASRDATVSEFKSVQMEQQLHQNYIQREQQSLRKNGGPAQQTAMAVSPDEPPRAMFKNDDYGRLLVTIRDLRGREGMVWNFELKEGEIKVFPDDEPQAPYFQYESGYAVSWMRGYGSQMFYDKFWVSVKRRSWNSERGVWLSGWYQFLPNSRGRW